MTEQEPRIFLCHASDDKPRVIELYHQLKEAGYNPWLDKYDLLPGQDWRTEIEKIISDPYNLVVVCLSRKSIDKRGVVQEEIAIALDVLKKMPEDIIYLIPARLGRCQVPRRLSHLQRVDLFEADGFEKLRRSLDSEIGKRLPPFEPELVLIPAGQFLMGSNPNKDNYALENELPQHALHLPDYYLAKMPVTNAQYAAFIEATGHEQPKNWRKSRYPPKGKKQHPVVMVSWYDAMAYCAWLTELTGKPYRLPSEPEWEKGARGTDGRIYPWGDERPDETRCNFRSNVGGTTGVGQYSPKGDSPYGCFDTAGNIWEWTRSLWGTGTSETDFKYPYDPLDGREDLEVRRDIQYVVRGGSFSKNEWKVRCAYRTWSYPKLHFGDQGFRVVVSQYL